MNEVYLKEKMQTSRHYRGWKYVETRLKGKVIATDLFDPKGKKQWAWNTPTRSFEESKAFVDWFMAAMST